MNDGYEKSAIVPDAPDMVVRVALGDDTPSGRYYYDPAEMSFAVGESVRFELIGEDEFHTFTIRELDIDTAVNARETKILDVVFDSPGEYILVCIPHETLGMTGIITVR